MKLNPDCIRDILLTNEEITDLSKRMPYPTEQVYPLLTKYTDEEILYHIKQCELSGFFVDVRWYSLGCLVFHLSPDGHEFLSNISSDKNWTKTKEIAKEVGTFSLDALTKIATSVISGLIVAHFK